MRTSILLIFAIVFGVIGYALEPQAVNRFFYDLFVRGKTGVGQTVQGVVGSLAFTREEVLLGGRNLHVQVADSESERYRGLSGRTSLGADRGMLFVFDRPERYVFTMRGMKFPLDFVWLKNGRVVGVSVNILPPAVNASPETIPSPEVVDAVLEVNAGSVSSWHVGVGTELVRPGGA